MTIRVIEDSHCKLLMKKAKTHERAVVGLEFIRDPINHKLILISLAHDSIKFWNVVASEDDFEIFEKKKIHASYCGIQSYDVANNGRLIAVLGVESTIHTLKLDDNFGLADSNSFNKGIMEAWHLKILDDPTKYFTVSFSGLLRVVRENGEWDRQNAFEKVRTITTVAYSPSGTYIAVGNSHGLVHIVDPNTLASLFTIEAHSAKIRCIQFAPDESHIITGSDDKTIKLFAISESKGTLLRTFYGHRRSVTAISVERCSGGERFCSAALDNRLILWETASGAKIHVFENTAADFNTCVKFSPDGRFLVTATDESTILAYRIPRPDQDVVMENDEAVGANGVNGSDEDEPMDTNGGDDLMNDYFGGSISPTSPPAPENVEMAEENGDDHDENHQNRRDHGDDNEYHENHEENDEDHDDPANRYDITLPGETTLDSAVNPPLSPNASMFNATIDEDIEGVASPSTPPPDEADDVDSAVGDEPAESYRPPSSGEIGEIDTEQNLQQPSDENESPPPRPQYGGPAEDSSPYQSE